MDEATRRYVAKLRSAHILDSDGRSIEKVGLLAFCRERNPDADDGTYVGKFMDVTKKP